MATSLGTASEHECHWVAEDLGLDLVVTSLGTLSEHECHWVAEDLELDFALEIGLEMLGRWLRRWLGHWLGRCLEYNSVPSLAKSSISGRNVSEEQCNVS